jgi:hypothetical protein
MMYGFRSVRKNCGGHYVLKEALRFEDLGFDSKTMKVTTLALRHRDGSAYHGSTFYMVSTATEVILLNPAGYVVGRTAKR